MTFPTGTTISTANVASVDSDPSQARADIYNLITAVNSIISSANAALGVLVLDASGRISGTRMPGTFNPTGNLSFQPSTGIINIQNVLRLAQIYSEDLGTVNGTASPTAGDMIYLVDGDAGTPCLGVYDGTQWRVVRLMMPAGSAQSALSTTVSLTATAVA